MAYKGRTPTGLVELATRQHGVVSAQQLAALGYSRGLIVKEADRGRLLPLHQRVYAVGHRRLDWHGWCWAVVLGAEPLETDEVVWPAVASHLSAAYLWGLLRYRPETMHVTAPTRRRAKRRFKVYFSSILAAEDRSVREGIPVTAVPRTLLDLSIGAHPEQLEGYLELAEKRGLFGPPPWKRCCPHCAGYELPLCSSFQRLKLATLGRVATIGRTLPVGRAPDRRQDPPATRAR